MLTLSGTELAKKIKVDVSHKIEEHLKEGKRPPCLVTILVGDDSASKVYVANKEKEPERFQKYSRLELISYIEKLEKAVRDALDYEEIDEDLYKLLFDEELEESA